MNFIRLLTQHDALAYKEIRLTVLQSNPDAFLSDYEFEKDQPDHFFKNTVLDNYDPPHFGYFGYIVDDKLVGYVQLIHHNELKNDHTGQIFNLSVLPDNRKQGIGKVLMEHVIQQATAAGLEVIYLSCLSSNLGAKKLYESLGFVLWGTKPKAIKWQGKYQDELSFYQLI